MVLEACGARPGRPEAARGVPPARPRHPLARPKRFVLLCYVVRRALGQGLDFGLQPLQCGVRPGGWWRGAVGTRPRPRSPSSWPPSSTFCFPMETKPLLVCAPLKLEQQRLCHCRGRRRRRRAAARVGRAARISHGGVHQPPHQALGRQAALQKAFHRGVSVGPRAWGGGEAECVGRCHCATSGARCGTTGPEEAR